MEISKIKTFFQQLDLDSNKKISKSETEQSPYSSIFSNYFSANEEMDYADFCLVVESDESLINDLSKPESDKQLQGSKVENQISENSLYSVKNDIVMEKSSAKSLTQVPSDEKDFQWHIWWGAPGVDLRGNDASALDLSNKKILLEKSNFDTNTKFPENAMPKDFNPKKGLEDSKNPGLGLKELHKDGYTGKGINVAIIDLPMSVNHSEFKDNIINYTETGFDSATRNEMHGYATTSILAGKSVGVAPDAKVAFFASNFVSKNALTGEIRETNKYVTESLNKIYEMNEKLPESQRMKAVSLSWSPKMQDADYKDFKAAVQRLEDSGVYVQYNDNDEPDCKMKFDGLNRNLNSNPDDIKSYRLGEYVPCTEDEYANRTKGNNLLIPAGHRTTAGPTSEDNYVNYSNGGISWQIPYIAGVYTVAKQANPGLTPNEFRKKVLETATPYYSQNSTLVGKIINPKKLIESVK